VLEPVVGAGQDDPRLIPDYLLMMQESAAQEAIENLRRPAKGREAR
jgi:hypothetical protein